MSASGEILNEEFLKPLGLITDASRKAIKIGNHAATVVKRSH